MEDPIRVRGLSKSFGSAAAVDGLSFDLKRGETLGILDPNGAGKSTLFGLISGDYLSSAGSILFEDQDITHLPAHALCRLGIGRSYQMPHPFTRMTVYENLLVAATSALRESEAACHDWCIDVTLFLYDAGRGTT